MVGIFIYAGLFESRYARRVCASTSGVGLALDDLVQREVRCGKVGGHFCWGEEDEVQVDWLAPPLVGVTDLLPDVEPHQQLSAWPQHPPNSRSPATTSARGMWIRL